MNAVLDFPPEAITVDRTAVVAKLGATEEGFAERRHVEAYHEAEDLFVSKLEAKAVVRSVDRAEFEAIYSGEGLNDESGPVPGVAARADDLALFLLSLGSAVSEAVTRLFAAHDYLAAALLDAMASTVAEDLVEALEDIFAESCRRRAGAEREPAVLAYSPGYCGWHVSGQKRLFALLDGDRIGVTLEESCVMRPLKSVSGVLLAGPAGIHDFDPSFDCCSVCDTFECRARIARVSHSSGERSREVSWKCSPE